ncbi:hypothetical protein A2T98_07000 [Nodularia spumigena CENA596]|uniref:Uncharacterized protein n=2 Tax=Nodularia spumigena TaxID=70799 RepID=A0A161UWQ7_NODSP|nr:hypothetical protein A2T98_07000 [Nodularia spumigena CENA596]
MNMVPRNTGETLNFEAGCTTRISRFHVSKLSQMLVKIVGAVTPFLCCNEQASKIEEQKCHIQLTGAGEDETMFVRTS